MNDQYLKYDAIELAQDEAFLRWVRKEENSAALQWESWLAAHPEKAEAVADARLLARALLFREEKTSPEQIEQIWARIHAATPAEQVKKPLRIVRWGSYAAAAAIALLLAFFFLWPASGEPVQLLAQNGKTVEAELPDGSQVWLNASSSITYKTAQWPEKRSLKLSGEAFFEVQKGSRFVVETERGAVEVLGTSFNVNTHDGQFSVECYSGRVQVRAGQASEILTPGQSATLAAGGLKKENFEASTGVAWRQGHFEYENTPLTLVFAELERQFDVSIEAPDSIRQRRYTGFFERNSLDSALYLVCWPMQLESSLDGERIQIGPAKNAGE